MKPSTVDQSLFTFEQETVDAVRAVAYAKLQTKLAAKAQRAILKRQAELDKASRRFKREQKRKEKTPDEHAQCGIRWYCRSPQNLALGNYWKHCHACGQLLIYTSDPDAKPQVCAGRKP
jgi:hypothetical protein